MFKKREKYLEYCHNGETYSLPESLFRRIRDLETQVIELRCDNRYLMKDVEQLKAELDVIRPVVASKQLEPALSNQCIECKFCVKDKYNRYILGCNLNAVCVHFEREEEK